MYKKYQDELKEVEESTDLDDLYESYTNGEITEEAFLDLIDLI